jgi:hypothetical protein
MTLRKPKTEYLFCCVSQATSKHVAPVAVRALIDEVREPAAEELATSVIDAPSGTGFMVRSRSTPAARNVTELSAGNAARDRALLKQ